MYADKVKNKTLACPSIVVLQKSMNIDMKDALALDMYTIKNNCVILSKQSEIEAVGYDPRNSTDRYQKIIRKKTGRELFILRSAILVEQGGKKNSMRF